MTPPPDRGSVHIGALTYTSIPTPFPQTYPENPTNTIPTKGGKPLSLGIKTSDTVKMYPNIDKNEGMINMTNFFDKKGSIDNNKKKNSMITY